jgi:hypothetical protein
MTTTEATLRNMCAKIGVTVEYYGESVSNFQIPPKSTFAARFRYTPAHGYSRTKEVFNVPVDVDIEKFINDVLKSIE